MPHWKKAFNPDYLGSWSLENGQDLILTIDSVRVETVTGENGRKEECLIAHFKENVKPMILNKTNCKTISKIHKTPDYLAWAGKRIQVYQTTTKFAGEIVDCLRIRPSVPRETAVQKIMCEKCGKQIMNMGSRTAEYLAGYTRDKYGKALCTECAVIASKEKENAETENLTDENNENKD